MKVINPCYADLNNFNSKYLANYEECVTKINITLASYF